MRMWWPRIAWLSLIMVVGGPALALTISPGAFAGLQAAQVVSTCCLLLLPVGVGLGIASLLPGHLEDRTVAWWAVGLGFAMIVLAGPIVVMVLVGDVHGA